MKELKIPASLKNKLRNLIQNLQDIYREDLISLVLYGSAASGEFVDKHSNLNLLAVLKNTDLVNLDKASRLLNKYMMIDLLFLTEDYIVRSADVFPIEFLDMQENYFVLYGKDVLKDIRIDIRNLRFQCEQELKAKLIRLRQAYLRINRDKTALRNLLFKSFTSILHILRNVLRLKGKKPAYIKKEILQELALEFQININIWEKILAARNKQIKLNKSDTQDFFINFVRDLDKIAEAIDRL